MTHLPFVCIFRLMDNSVVSLMLDSFWKILKPGLQMTIPLTLLSFAFALVIATVTALVQEAKIPVLRQLARFYIWVIRETPALLV